MCADSAHERRQSTEEAGREDFQVLSASWVPGALGQPLGPHLSVLNLTTTPGRWDFQTHFGDRKLRQRMGKQTAKVPLARSRDGT